MRLLFTIDTKDYDPEGKAFVRPSARCIAIREGRVAMVYSRKYDYYKFPGGGIERGETREQALIRECQEELAVILDVGRVFMDVIHEYPDLTVHLTLFNASIQAGIPQKLEHNDIRWITVDEIDQYDFCPADEEILTRLKTIE